MVSRLLTDDDKAKLLDIKALMGGFSAVAG